MTAAFNFFTTRTKKEIKNRFVIFHQHVHGAGVVSRVLIHQLDLSIHPYVSSIFPLVTSSLFRVANLEGGFSSKVKKY